MKKIILTCIIPALITGSTIAQVSNAEFVSKINMLTDAINAKNTSKETSAFNVLTAAMDAQMSNLSSQINASKSAYTTDNAKAEADMRAAISEKTAAENELTKAEADMNAGKSSAQTDIQKAQNDVIKARDDEKAAHQERDNAKQELLLLNKQSDNLNTEKKMYTELQPLKTNITANKDKIIADLKTFASTLN